MTESFLLSPPSARLLLCERTGDWAAAMRRELAEAGVRVWETRSLADAWAALGQAPASLLIVELTVQNMEHLLGRMARLSHEFPLARVAVVAERAMAGHEWLLREAGAVHFVCSPRQLAPLAEIALRHLAEVPSPPQTMVERIWASLPWARS
jgi:hypothetical protein